MSDHQLASIAETLVDHHLITNIINHPFDQSSELGILFMQYLHNVESILQMDEPRDNEVIRKYFSQHHAEYISFFVHHPKYVVHLPRVYTLLTLLPFYKPLKPFTAKESKEFNTPLNGYTQDVGQCRKATPNS